MTNKKRLRFRFEAEAFAFIRLMPVFLFRAFCTPRFKLREEIVAFVVNKDESREILNSDFPNSLHA